MLMESMAESPMMTARNGLSNPLRCLTNHGGIYVTGHAPCDQPFDAVGGEIRSSFQTGDRLAVGEVWSNPMHRATEGRFAVRNGARVW
jgi:hypothetical protein